MIEIKGYLTDVREKLTSMLNLQKNSTAKKEKAFQHFFEEYPTALLPALDDVQANYSIYGGLVISQPRFKSLEMDRQPDFLIVTSNSLNLYFNFIELEDPSKKIFNLSEQKPTTDFFEAYNQLKQWSSFSDNEVQNYCKHLLETLFNDNYDSRTHKKHHYNYVLVYGFSDEIVNIGSSRNHLLQDYFKANLFHCTYSRIINNLTYKRKLISVKRQSNGKYKAIGLTPFKVYKNDEWSDYHNVIDKEDVVNASIYLTDNEKADLITQMKLIDVKTFKQISHELLKSDGLNVLDISDLEI